MNTEDCFELGHITKASGYKGEVTAFFDVDIPQAYRGLDTVIVERGSNLIPYLIESLNYVGKNKFRMKLEGVSTEEQALSLAKCRLLLPLAALPKLKGKQFYYHEIIGYTVVDHVAGDIGIIQDVTDHPTNPLLVVKKGNKELLLPLRNEFYGAPDRTKQIFHYIAPEGLIEVFLGEDKSDSDPDE